MEDDLEWDGEYEGGGMPDMPCGVEDAGRMPREQWGVRGAGGAWGAAGAGEFPAVEYDSLGDD